MSINRSAYLFAGLSLLLLVSGAGLVWLNHQGAHAAMLQAIGKEGRALRDAYELAIGMRADYMSQTAAYVARDPDVARLFRLGRDAVKLHGADSAEAGQLRRELHAQLTPAWNRVTRDYGGRQLHFHLPPATSFLRMHKPERYGDDLSRVRHSLVEVNRFREPVTGFESGRLYSGIRGIQPVFDVDPATGTPAFVGSVEVGTSYVSVLEGLAGHLGVNVAVWMSDAHVKEVMWPESYHEYRRTHPVMRGHMLESTTHPEIAQLVRNLPANVLRDRHSGTHLLKVGNRNIALTAFGLRDFAGERNERLADVGSVMIWTSADDAVSQFDNAVTTNLTVGIPVFLVLELVLFLVLGQEHRIVRAELMANIDGLTLINNRRGFDEDLNRELSRLSRSDGIMALIIGDIDNFKRYNDSMGHIAGDQALKKVAGAIAASLRRPADAAARIGGEEFAIILPDTDLYGAIATAENIRQCVDGLQLPLTNTVSPRHLTLSLGVTVISGREVRDGKGGTDVMRRADGALYRAKQNGRNRVETWKSPTE